MIKFIRGITWLAIIFLVVSCTKTIEQINYIQPAQMKLCSIYVKTGDKQSCYLYDSTHTIKAITITPSTRTAHCDTIQWPESTFIKAEFSTGGDYPVIVDTIAYSGLVLKW